MKIHVLFDRDGAHIELDGTPSDVAAEASLERVLAQVRAGQQVLAGTPIDDIIGLCHAIAKNWTLPGSPLAEVIRHQGLGFVPLWMRRDHLERLSDLSLRGNRHATDRFVQMSADDSRLFRAQPRGVIVHWIAGNVPVLGMLSFLQATLGKNGSLVKAPRADAGLLPFLLDSFRDADYTNSAGQTVSGELIANSVAAVYVERDDADAAREMSVAADVRVAWGGRQAVESIMNLPRRFGTEDIVFGPKVSLIVIARENLDTESAAGMLARDLTRDVVAFDQRGCNSPHTVFVETGGAVTPSAFTALIAQALQDAAARKPLLSVQPGDCTNVLTARAEYDMRGEAYYSRGMGWTVLYSDDDEGLATPSYLRTIFVRPISDIFDVVAHCSIDTQTAGLAVGERRLELADALTQAGVERCPAVGGMSLYESPWDGMFPIARMVRWVTTIGLG